MLNSAIRTLRNPPAIGSGHVINVSVAKKKLYARAIQRIVDQNSREVVGWVYEWNTGERGKTWKNGRRANVVYE